MSRPLCEAPLLAFSLALCWCASCQQSDPYVDAGHRDTDRGEPEDDVDLPVEADVGITDGEEEADAETDRDQDADADEEALPAPMPMELVELPRDRDGRDCGVGCQQLTFAGSPFYKEYDVGSDYLTYAEMGSGYERDIYLINFETLAEFRLDACESYWCGFPVVYQNNVVFKTAPHDLDEDVVQTIWHYHIGDEYRFPLVRRRMTERARSMREFDLNGDTAIWYDSSIAPAGMYAIDVNDLSIIDFTPELRCPCYGRLTLWGRQVVYEGWQISFSNVYLVDIDTLEERNLTFEEMEVIGTVAPMFNPAFDGERIVWADARNDPSRDPVGTPFNSDIYGMELPDGPQEPICTHPAIQTDPDVHQGLVAWEDYRNAEDPNDRDPEDNVDIFMFDLETGLEQQVTDLPGPERHPRIWGDRLFFVAEDLIGQPAVFMVDLVEAGLIEPR